MSGTEESKRREVVSFRVGPQEFCVDIMSVREIRGWSHATPLPHAPSYVRGLINLRGTVLPVIDMSERLGLGAAEAAQRRVNIVVWIGTRLVGLLVDAVCDIIEVGEGVVKPVPDLCGDSVQAFASGILTVDDRMICLIALDRLVPELDSSAAA